MKSPGDQDRPRAALQAGLPRGSLCRMALAVGSRPDLWWAALGALRRMASPGWWRSPPYLPAPDGGLWGFRMVTAYGRADAEPRAEDVVSYLEWCRSTAVRHRLFRPGTAVVRTTTLRPPQSG